MIRLTYVRRRLPTLSRQEFQRYRRHTHGPLVAKHATTLACRKSVQVHTLEDPLNTAFAEARGLMEPYDGMAALWWNNAEERLQVLSTPAGQHATEDLLEDEHHFIDFVRSAMWFAMEVPQVNPTPETLLATETSPFLCLVACFQHLPPSRWTTPNCIGVCVIAPRCVHTLTPAASAAIFGCIGWPLIPLLINCGRGVAGRFAAPAGHKSLAVALALMRHDDARLRDLEWSVLTTATAHHPTTLDWLRTVPGIGESLSLVLR